MNGTKKVPDLPRSTILVVDDERFNLDLLRDILSPTCDIMVATSGEQAIRRAASSPPPDLVLLDIQMPGMDGYRVLELLKADRATADIPVLFVTSMSEASDETRGLALGAVDYITKPLVPSVVLARIQTQLRLRQSVEQERILNQKLAGLNEELSASNQQLLELNRGMKGFLGMAAHDLCNPLTSIHGMSELLLSANLKQETRQEFLTSIKRVSEHGQSLVWTWLLLEKCIHIFSAGGFGHFWSDGSPLTLLIDSSSLSGQSHLKISMFNFRWLQYTQSVVLIYNRLILSACQFQVQLPCRACPLRLTCSARFQA
ncbi:MAG: hybrid sensor histidine kinase/response regulator [Magnetococcales bacterium]|nr:hybrid sensor histidine kinase/response regulator [Magnetococcales bacterium]